MLPPRMNSPLSCLIVLLFCGIAQATEALAPRIDALIQAELTGSTAPLASDAEFLRRVTLDLHGVIPTSEQARAFVADQGPDKRAALIQRLLDSPRFAIHMANVFDVMLMERRPDKYVNTPEWQKYLQNAFLNNVPFNELAREIIASDGTDPNKRPAAKFFLDRDAEPNIMARDIGRLFFGMDLQCAQCHDHPIVDHYLQTDYYGLFAFVNRTVVFTDEAAKVTYLGEKADGEATYKSVFTQDEGSIRPQLPGDDQIDEPRLRQGEDYVSYLLPGVRPAPKYSRRAKLAELAASGANRQFNINIANRLWAHMMGRGLVHPVDLHHPLNPPSNPAVLDLITNEFVANKFDVRWLLREIALSQAYQRSIDPPTEDPTQLASVVAQLPSLKANWESLKARASESQKAADTAQEAFRTARTSLAASETAWRTAETAVTAAKKPVDDALIALTKSQANATAKQAAVNALNEAVAKSAEAAKLLPNDKEIAAASATFVAKQGQLAGELEAAQKAVTDQTAALEPLKAKLQEAYVPADAAYAAYLEARKPVDAAKAAFIVAWNQHKADATAAAYAQKRLEALQSHESLQQSLTTIAASSSVIDSKKAELVAAISAAEVQQQEVTNRTNAVNVAQKNLADATKALEDIKAQAAEKQAVVQAVAEALTKTETAVQKLPGDGDLALLAQKLKDRHVSISNELDQLTNSVSGQSSTRQELEATMAQATRNFDSAVQEMTARQQGVAEKTAGVEQAIAAVKDAQVSVTSGREKLVDLWTVAGAVRPLKQLSPEQLAWALLYATGVLEPHWPAADAEIEKTIPKASAAADPAIAKQRQARVEQQLNESMRGNVTPFVNLYGASAGQPQDDFFATPDQALFIANGGTVIAWATSGTLAQKLAALTDPKAFTDELYLSVLTRNPTEVEVNETATYLASRPTERPQAIRELIWSLLTSAEFRFNH
ncbi:DUF1549 domain-containing protein [Schlesneria sp. T3-172]|uniref:DUF1549 domain-containing protein n=1 Tax=Schlesneria sphaerica TaxID=3373610 RepID=UPI0037CB353E